MADQPLSPARIAFDAAGVPHAVDFEDVYHSADGGLAQARAVFIAGNDLPRRWRGRRSFTILETGFGLGLNFLCCCAELRGDPAGPARLHYVAVDKHPPRSEDLARAHAAWPELSVFAAELHRAWPPALAGFHRLDLAGGRIGLTLLFGEAEHVLAELDAHVDALFLDGFAPAKNPAMWSDALFRQIERLTAPGTTAATWSVAAQVRSRLEQAGFAVSKRPGFGRKREMLAAVRAGAPASATASAQRPRHAAVIGAGLAGAWIAHALAARGWDVDLLERHPGPAEGASANPIGVLRPAFNLADNANARLARAAFLRTTRLLQADPAFTDLHARTGLLHVATTPERAQRMVAILHTHGFSADFVRWVDAKEAAGLAGRPVAGPGWWIPDGGWARPQALSLALIARHADRICTRFGAPVHSLVRAGAGWHALDEAGRTLAQAPVVVLANGYDARRLSPAQLPGLVPVRGQVSFLPAAAQRPLEIVVGGDGYVAPLPGGGHAIGATFEPGVDAPDIRSADHARNLARAERMLPGFTARAEAARLIGWAGTRAATADRLPACGALPNDAQIQDRAGGYVVTGLGARGLIWAPLCAEVLAARLEGEPTPIERGLLAALDPLRQDRGRA